MLRRLAFRLRNTALSCIPTFRSSPDFYKNHIHLPIFNTSSHHPMRSKAFSTSSFKGIDRETLSTVVDLIANGRGETKFKLLSQMNRLRISHSSVAEILLALNNRCVSAVAFFGWVLNNHPWFKPNSNLYNLVTDNLGRLGDHQTMVDMLTKLSSNQHCLTDKAFAFVSASSSSPDLKDRVEMVIDVLNKVGGSCRSSGIHSLIKVLCGIGRFDLAVFVMGETARKLSYYHVLIAAKCKKGRPEDAQRMFDEMQMYGCHPCTTSYNYLLGCLFKNRRFVEGCELLEKMEHLGYIHDPVTYEVVIVHACKVNRMDFAVEILNKMFLDGLKPRLTTHAAFIKGYYWFGRVDDAYKYVADMSLRDGTSSSMNYSLLASLLRLSGRVVEASKFLHEMMKKMLKPNFPVYIKVVKDLHKINRVDLALDLKSVYNKLESGCGIR